MSRVGDNGRKARSKLQKEKWQDVCWPTAWMRVALSIFTKAVCSQIASERKTVNTALRYDHNKP